MPSPNVLTQEDGPLFTITLNRPEKANALSFQMLANITEALEQAATNDDLRAVIITSAGGKVFCAGADLSELTTDQDDPSVQLWENLSTALTDLPILSVAMMNGPCIGGGLTLALGCDIRIGVPETRFQYPVLKNRVYPGEMDVSHLKALIGPGRMSSLLLGGQVVDSQMAHAWGLLDHLVSRDDLLSTAHSMVETACAAPRENVVHLKRLCREAKA